MPIITPDYAYDIPATTLSLIAWGLLLAIALVAWRAR